MSEEKKEQKKEEPSIRVKNTPPFKLKDRPRRNFVFINFEKQFGFKPDTIIVEKVRGMNNGLIVRAVLTEEEMKKEDERIKEKNKLLKNRELRIKKHIQNERESIANEGKK